MPPCPGPQGCTGDAAPPHLAFRRCLTGASLLIFVIECPPRRPIHLLWTEARFGPGSPAPTAPMRADGASQNRDQRLAKRQSLSVRMFEKCPRSGGGVRERPGYATRAADRRRPLAKTDALACDGQVGGEVMPCAS